MVQNNSIQIWLIEVKALYLQCFYKRAFHVKKIKGLEILIFILLLIQSANKFDFVIFLM